MKLNREAKIALIVVLAIYAMFTAVRIAMFPDQSFMWHFELSLLGLASILFFGFAVKVTDDFLDRKYPFERNIYTRILLQFIITFFVITTFRWFGSLWLRHLVPHKVAREIWFISFAANLIMVLVVILFIFGYHFFRRWKEQKLIAAELEKEKALVQYDNLKNQLNPHFLFNSLSSLNSLIFVNPQLASEFLQQLSKVYRYVLENKQKNLVTLETELSFVKHYVQLLKARFEEGMEVNFDIDKSELSKGIAPVTLQILIENALKHNTTQKSAPLLINISSRGNALIVQNNIQRKAVIDGSNGQGLENLKNLYHYLSDKPVTVEEKENMFTVTIPMLEV